MCHSFCDWGIWAQLMSQTTAITVWTGLQVSQGLTGGGSASAFTQEAVGRVPSLTSSWQEVSLSSLPHGPLGVQLTKWKLASFSVRKCVQEWSCHLFSNIILEVTSHYFCFVLFSGNKSLNPVLDGAEGDYPWISGEGNHLGEQKWGCLPPTCCVFQVWQSCQRLQMIKKLFVEMQQGHLRLNCQYNAVVLFFYKD